MLEQSISIDRLIEVLKRIKERDGLETITSFELLHVLPSDESAQQSVHPTNGGLCAECGLEEWHHPENGHEFKPAISG